MDTTLEEASLKKRTVTSTLSLFFQSGYAAFLGLAANLVVTILLSPQIFGIYITTLSFLSVLNYFSDIGLGASLIQKKEITDDDIKTTFTVQQLLIVGTITIGFLLTPFIMSFYKLPREGQFLFWSLLAGFFISSLKTIPSILLERNVKFQKIVFVQVVENTVFYISVIFFALLGFKLNSFTIAVLLRSVVGLVTIYSIAFWHPSLGISTKSLKELLSFGLPIQANSFLALIKDDFIILYLGKVLGFEGVGYIGWAKKWAEAPIRIIMDNISRVLFPVLSRTQHDKGFASKIVEKILHYQTLILAPTIIGMMLLMGTFVSLIPKYAKWEPALPLFYIFAAASLFSSYSTPFINLFNAIGKVKISFYLMITWTVATWILTPLLTHFFERFGFPMNQLLLSLTFFIVVFEAKKLITFRFIPNIYKPIMSSCIMGTGIIGILILLNWSLYAFIASIVVGGSLYILSLHFLFTVNIMKEIKHIFTYD